MPSPNINSYDKVRHRLLLCIRLSHGIDHAVFMDELEYTLSRVLACFYPDVDEQQHGMIYDSLRSEFQNLTADEIRHLVIQECGYCRSVIWPRIESFLCWMLFVIAAPFEITWVRRTIGFIMFPVNWILTAWLKAVDTILRSILPARFFENKTVTYHYLSWLPTTPEDAG